MHSASSPTRTGVLLIGHGTRDPVGTSQFFQLGEQLSQTLAPLPVESCLLEFQDPTIPQAWRSLVGRGVQHIHAAPLLLFAAGHAKQDIPDLLLQCQRETPHLTFDQCRPISRHRRLIDLVVKRINETLSDSEIAGSKSTALLMVGRGNRDPCAQAEMRVLTEVIAHRFRFAAAHTAFYAIAEPSLTDVLAKVAATGRFQSIVIHPHLLFAGRLFQAIGGQIDEAAERYPHIGFYLGNYLGPEPEVAEAIAGRVGEC